MAVGVFAVARGIFDHPFFAPEPFTEREAWLWMLENAVWKATRVRVRHGTQDLERGQLSFSTRFMGSRWRWTESRVRRFLARLKIDAMINTQADAQSTLITICNYDKYQSWQKPIDALSDAQPDARATQIRRREEISSSSLRSEDTSLATDDVGQALSAYENMAKASGLPLVRAITDARRRKMASTLTRHGLAVWNEALAKITASSFCCGANDRGWRADLDFLLTPSKFVKLIEGQYDNRAPQARGSPRTVADLARSLSNAGADYDQPQDNTGPNRAALEQLPSPSGRGA